MNQYDLAVAIYRDLGNCVTRKQLAEHIGCTPHDSCLTSKLFRGRKCGLLKVDCIRAEVEQKQKNGKTYKLLKQQNVYSVPEDVGRRLLCGSFT